MFLRSTMHCIQVFSCTQFWGWGGILAVRKFPSVLFGYLSNYKTCLINEIICLRISVVFFILSSQVNEAMLSMTLWRTALIDNGWRPQQEIRWVGSILPLMMQGRQTQAIIIHLQDIRHDRLIPAQPVASGILSPLASWFLMTHQPLCQWTGCVFRMEALTYSTQHGDFVLLCRHVHTCSERVKLVSVGTTTGL